MDNELNKMNNSFARYIDRPTCAVFEFLHTIFPFKVWTRKTRLIYYYSTFIQFIKKGYFRKKKNAYSLLQISHESSHRWNLFQSMHISKVNFRITDVWSRSTDDKYSFVTWQFSNFNGIIINLFHARIYCSERFPRMGITALLVRVSVIADVLAVVICFSHSKAAQSSRTRASPYYNALNFLSGTKHRNKGRS